MCRFVIIEMLLQQSFHDICRTLGLDFHNPVDDGRCEGFFEVSRLGQCLSGQ